MKADRLRQLATGSALAALAAAAYATSFGVPFLSGDDAYYVTASARTQLPGWQGLANIWSLADLWRGQIIEYFPLRDTVYWVLWQAFGANPAPFHAANIAAHIVAVLLVRELAIRIDFSPRVASWGAAIFAVHPVHVESVAWIAGLKDPLFFALVLASLIVYQGYRVRGGSARYAGFVALMTAALMVKSIAVMTPVLALALERYTAPRCSRREVAARLAGPAALSALFLALYVTVGRVADIVIEPHGGTWSAHALLAGWALVRYAQQAVVPASFSFRYCFRPIAGLWDWRAWATFAVGAASIVAYVVAHRRAPKAALLAAWFWACLLPVSNLIPFPAVMADRYLYASVIATSLGMAWLADRLPGRTPARVLGAAVAIFGLTTAARGLVWQDEASLWAEAASDGDCAVDPEPHGALVLMKDAHYEADPVRSYEKYERALAAPGFTRWAPRNDKGQRFQCTFLAEGVRRAVGAAQGSRAIQLARQTVDLCPMRADAWDSLAYAVLAVDPKAAVDAALRARELEPSPERRWRLGLARMRAGDSGGEVEAADAVVQDPTRLCSKLVAWANQGPAPLGRTWQEAERTCGLRH